MRRSILAAIAVLAIVGAAGAAVWLQRTDTPAPIEASDAEDATALQLPPMEPVRPLATPSAPPDEVRGRPNVLFVVWDTVRADRLSVYGHDRSTTPFLEQIAPQARVFDQAISPSYWTLPSHASLFTGLSVSSHGANARYQWLDGRFLTMAEHFRDEGYDTYAWSSNPNINRSANTVQGFDTFHQPFAQNAWRRKVEEATKALLHPLDQTTRDDPERYKNISHHKGGAVTHDAFTGWLDSRDTGPDSEPFFAFINYMEAHAYRLPSEQARQSVLPDPRDYHRALRTPNLLKRQTNVMYGRWKPYKRNQRQGLYDLYDASIWDMDRYLGRLMEDLAARGVLENTVVVVTADHGEQFGEHGLYLHNFSVYQPLVHVPLVVWGPGVTPGRTEEPVSTAALFHTLVELLGLEPPEAPILRHDLLHDDPRPVVSELTVPCANPERRNLDTSIRDWTASYKAVYDGQAKLIRASNGRHELYNLARDPRETRNVYDPASEVAERLSGLLQEWMVQQPRLEVSQEERDQEAALREAEVDEELMKQLEELGYTE